MACRPGPTDCSFYTRSSFRVRAAVRYNPRLAMMLRFTNTDSSGRAVTDRIAVTVDGERYEYEVAATGTVNVAEPVADYLLESDDLSVEPYESDSGDADLSDE